MKQSAPLKTISSCCFDSCHDFVAIVVVGVVVFVVVVVQQPEDSVIVNSFAQVGTSMTIRVCEIYDYLLHCCCHCELPYRAVVDVEVLMAQSSVLMM
jgi:hypothetical protein